MTTYPKNDMSIRNSLILLCTMSFLLGCKVLNRTVDEKVNLEQKILDYFIENFPSDLSKHLESPDAHIKCKQHSVVLSSRLVKDYYFSKHRHWSRELNIYDDTTCVGMEPLIDQNEYKLIIDDSLSTKDAHEDNNLVRLIIYSRISYCNHFYVIGNVSYTRSGIKNHMVLILKYNFDFDLVDSLQETTVISD